MTEYVTVDQLVDGREALERILGLALHPVTNHRLVRITKFLDEEKLFFLAARDPLVRKYGEADPKDETAHSVQPGMKNWPLYVEAVSELLAEKIPFPFNKIKVVDLPPLTPKELMKLQFMIEGVPADEKQVEAEAAEDEIIKTRAEERAKRREAIKTAKKAEK